MSQMALYIGNLPDIELAAGTVSAPQRSLLLNRSFTADCNGLYVQAVTSTAAEGSLQLANMQAVWRRREAAMGRLNTLAMLLSFTSCLAQHPQSA